MPDLQLLAGEQLWDADGKHVVNDKGVAVVCTEPTTVTIVDPDKFANAESRVLAARQIKIDANARKYTPPDEEG